MMVFSQETQKYPSSIPGQLSIPSQSPQMEIHAWRIVDIEGLIFLLLLLSTLKVPHGNKIIVLAQTIHSIIVGWGRG